MINELGSWTGRYLDKMGKPFIIGVCYINLSLYQAGGGGGGGGAGGGYFQYWIPD